jgi:hypothetical protein
MFVLLYLVGDSAWRCKGFEFCLLMGDSESVCERVKYSCGRFFPRFLT